MDISPSTLSALASERIASQVSTKVAVKSLDAMKQAGQAAVALLGALEAQGFAEGALEMRLRCA